MSQRVRPRSKRKRLNDDEGAGPSTPRKLNTTMTKEEEDSLRHELEELAKDNCAVSTNMGLTWFRELREEFREDYFDKIKGIIRRDRLKSTVYPPEDLVYAWTTFAPIYDTKVVILGQDPHHGPNQANGLAYSVKKNQRIPPSLENIYVELSHDIENFVQPAHGDLSGWAKQGVVLLNCTLTVRAGAANSHVGCGWDDFTDAVVKWLSDNCEHIVFLCWGNYAARKIPLIDKTRHLVLRSAHPSPRSVQGFQGRKHFSQTNHYLVDHGKAPIIWSNLPLHEFD